MSESRFDATELGALFAKHHGELFRYAARFTGDRDLAEDVVQDAFMRLAEHPGVEPAAQRAWLYKVATTIAIDAGRTVKRRDALAVTGVVTGRLSLGDPGPDPERAAEQADVRTRVRAALAHLEERDRVVLLMREEGFTHHEIADAVGTTTKSIGTMIARALEKLARHLELDERDL